MGGSLSSASESVCRSFQRVNELYRRVLPIIGGWWKDATIMPSSGLAKAANDNDSCGDTIPSTLRVQHTSRKEQLAQKLNAWQGQIGAPLQVRLYPSTMWGIADVNGAAKDSSSVDTKMCDGRA
jgi:hypothetical protein